MDVEIAAMCTGAIFCITGEDGEDCFEGVESFNYLGGILNPVAED